MQDNGKQIITLLCPTQRYFTNYITKYKTEFTSGLNTPASISNNADWERTFRHGLRVTSKPGSSGQYGLLVTSEGRAFGDLP